MGNKDGDIPPIFAVGDYRWTWQEMDASGLEMKLESKDYKVRRRRHELYCRERGNNGLLLFCVPVCACIEEGRECWPGLGNSRTSALSVFRQGANPETIATQHTFTC